MAENSKIEWTDHTVNLWWGCAKVHTGCKNCYAESLSNRFGENIWGEKAQRKLVKSAFKDLDKYQKRAKKANKRVKVFVGSMMDIFEDSKRLIGNPMETESLRNELFFYIKEGVYDKIIFLFLTKRPENITNFDSIREIGGCENVYFGISVSDQETYNNKGIGFAKSLKAVGCKVFFSCEPQIDVIDLRLSSYANLLLPDWIIQGGESGHKKRPFNLEWAYKMKNQCKKWNVPYFFKQIDKIKEIPRDLMIREFPNFGSVGKNILELETKISNEAQK